MQEFWIEKCWIPEDERPNTIDFCVKVYICNECQICKTKIIIYNKGSSFVGGSFDHACEDFGTYLQVWQNRIKPGQTLSIGNINDVKNCLVDPTKDGMKCSGSCNSWHPMAIANQDNGTFICYGCRTRF